MAYDGPSAEDLEKRRARRLAHAETVKALLGEPSEPAAAYSQEAVAVEITFSEADSERSTHWKLAKLTWPAFARRLTAHSRGLKRGSAITPATFSSSRRTVATAVEVRVAALDSDKGAPFSEIVDGIRSLGVAAAVATTHSHGTTSLLVPIASWQAWAQNNSGSGPEAYLLDRGYKAAVATGARLVPHDDGTSVGAEGQFIRIEHAPCPKIRVYVPVKTPWTADAGVEYYRAGLAQLAMEIGFEADPSGMEPAHLFFEPRFSGERSGISSSIISGRLADPWGSPKSFEALSAADEGASDQSLFVTDKDELRDLVRQTRRMRSPMPFETFASAVMAIRNDKRFDAYPNFIKVVGGIAVETNKSELGWQLLTSWIRSRCSGGNNDPERSRSYWDGVPIPAKPGHATGASIIALAKADGWSADSAKIDGYGDLDMGASFADATRGRLMYVSASAVWVAWHKVVWTQISSPSLEAIAKSAAREAYSVASRQYSDNPLPAAKSCMIRAMRYVDSIDRAKKIIEAGRSEPGMSVSSWGDFDLDPMLLGVKNGVVDLRTGSFSQPRPEDRISKQAGAAYDPSEECPRFQRFMAEVQPDAEVRSFLQRWAGYVLTGDISELKWLFCYGSGANGKTVFASVLSKLLGDYMFHADSALLTKNKHENEAARQIAQLPGKRFISANETSRGDVFDDERVKRLVSQEPLNARFLHREAFNFYPTGKLMLQGNHRPIAQDDSHGFWRRMVLVCFPVSLEGDKVIRDLDQTIFREEASGILNWAIDGCRQWRERGLAPPASLEKDKEEYKAESDTLGEWIEQKAIVREGVSTFLDEAFRSYVEHHREQGLSPMSQPTFTRAMRGKGFPKGGSKGRPKLLGLKLQDDGFSTRF